MKTNQPPREVFPLTTAATMGTMKEGGEDRRVRADKTPTKLKASPELLHLLVVLHTFFRDEAESMKSEANDLSAWEQLASTLFTLAELMKKEHDTLHG